MLNNRRLVNYRQAPDEDEWKEVRQLLVAEGFPDLEDAPDYSYFELYNSLTEAYNKGKTDNVFPQDILKAEEVLNNFDYTVLSIEVQIRKKINWANLTDKDVSIEKLEKALFNKVTIHKLMEIYVRNLREDERDLLLSKIRTEVGAIKDQVARLYELRVA